MTAEKVVVDADLWEWLTAHAHHELSCQFLTGDTEWTCVCGLKDIASRLDTAAVPVERYPNMSSSPYADVLWREVPR